MGEGKPQKAEESEKTSDRDPSGSGGIARGTSGVWAKPMGF